MKNRCPRFAFGVPFLTLLQLGFGEFCEAFCISDNREKVKVTVVQPTCLSFLSKETIHFLSALKF